MKSYAIAALVTWVAVLNSRASLADDYPRGDRRDAAEIIIPLIEKQDLHPLAEYLSSMKDQRLLDCTLVVFCEYTHKEVKLDKVGEAFELLMDKDTPETTVLAAELLLKAVDLSAPYDTDEFPDELCNRAASLLDNGDPVVQAIGQWTLARRVAKQNKTENWVNRLFTPVPNAADWHVKWQDRSADLALRDDYGRQLVNVNRHRTLDAVGEEGEKIADRCEKMLALSESQVASIDRERLEDAIGKARQAAVAGDLVHAHQTYLDLRLAVRETLIAGQDEFPTEGFVFQTAYSIPGGDNNVNGAVIGNDKPGGEIYIKRSTDPADSAEPLIRGRLGDGSIHGIDLHWNGDHIVFSFWHKPIGDFVLGFDRRNAHLYELDLKSDAIRQLTDDPSDNDIEPCYLPDGGFIFASDRSSFGNQCAGAFLQNKRCTTLFRLDEDRYREPVAISNNKDFDRFPSVLADGTVAFLHWEYQERHFYKLHTVWRCRPDGTNMDAFYKQHINTPYSIRTVRQVPDSQLCVATAQGHHDGHMGPVVLFDATLGINNAAAMWNVTPGTSGVEGGLGPLDSQIITEGGVENHGGYYINPFPMSDKAFLVGHEMSGEKADFAIYYIDVWGNRELLHRDRSMSCFQPVALRPRAVPPIVADTVDPNADSATVFLEDVNRGMPGVGAGAVKYLRVSQRLMLPAPIYEEGKYDINHLHWLPGVSTGGHFSYWTWAPTRTVGLVKVQDDGSAYFKVPAGMPVFLQALDENYCEVRRMRTSFTLQRGEFRSCNGCHESRHETVRTAASYSLSNLAREPQKPVPPSWGDSVVLDYRDHIQPILDAHCVKCHGQEKLEGGFDFTSREIGGFAQSYRTMFGLKPDDPTPIQNLEYHKPLHPDIERFKLVVDKPADRINKQMQRNEWPGMLVSISDRHDGADVTMPYQFGSNQSKLIRTLLDDPMHRKDVTSGINADQWLKLVTWIDHNAVYHSTVIDKSRYKQDGTLTRVEFHLPSPWQPADTCPSFFNEAVVTAGVR